MLAARERICRKSAVPALASEALSVWILSVHLVKRSVIFSLLLTLP